MDRETYSDVYWPFLKESLLVNNLPYVYFLIAQAQQTSYNAFVETQAWYFVHTSCSGSEEMSVWATPVLLEQ